MKPRLCRSSWRGFSSSHPFMFINFSTVTLLATPPSLPWNLPSFTVQSTFSSSCSRSDLPLSRQGAALAHLDSLPPYDLVLWTDGSVSFHFGKGGTGVLANCFLYGTEATLSFSAGPVCSSFSAEVCAILHAFCWFRQHQNICHFSSHFLLSDWYCPYHLGFFFSFPFTSISLADLAETVFFLLLFCQATMCPQTLAPPGKRRG